MNLNLKLFILLAVLGYSHSSNSLEKIDDNEFINLCATEKYVIVLFSKLTLFCKNMRIAFVSILITFYYYCWIIWFLGKPECKDCETIENELIAIREDLVDSLNAWVVKIDNSNLVHLYNPSKEPSLVFVRHGVPLLYHGKINDELILHTFRENIEPAVRELDDSNFEHLTQAASGATTGDWFVLL